MNPILAADFDLNLSSFWNFFKTQMYIIAAYIIDQNLENFYKVDAMRDGEGKHGVIVGGCLGETDLYLICEE